MCAMKETQPETAHLGIRLFDHFMSNKFTTDPDKRTIEQRDKMFAPVAALVAFWLATKFLERYPATLDDLMEVCGNRVKVSFDRSSLRCTYGLEYAAAFFADI